jgi:hypothetical protein
MTLYWLRLFCSTRFAQRMSRARQTSAPDLDEVDLVCGDGQFSTTHAVFERGLSASRKHTFEPTISSPNRCV